MRLDPFIEAEKVAGHSVNKACGLLEVSRAAYYERRNGAPRSICTVQPARVVAKDGESDPAP